jgi:hypothetical protein
MKVKHPCPRCGKDPNPIKIVGGTTRNLNIRPILLVLNCNHCLNSFVMEIIAYKLSKE